MKLTTRLNLVPKLSISGAAPPRPPYAFMQWTGQILPFLYTCCVKLDTKFSALKTNRKGLSKCFLFWVLK
jgi:hypothetical protein